MDSTQIAQKVLTDTVEIIANQDVISVYQKIIDSQSQTYNMILILFLGLVALFAGATWIYNRRVVKADIEKIVDEVFQKEKEKFLDGQKLEFKRELNLLKAESARLFAALNQNVIKTTTEDLEKFNAYANLVYWWSEVIINQIIAMNPIGIRTGIDNMIFVLSEIIKKNIEKEFFERYVTFYNYDNLFENLKFVDDTLINEKREIHRLLIEISQKNEDNQREIGDIEVKKGEEKLNDIEDNENVNK